MNRSTIIARAPLSHHRLAMLAAAAVGLGFDFDLRVSFLKHLEDLFVTLAAVKRNFAFLFRRRERFLPFNVPDSGGGCRMCVHNACRKNQTLRTKAQFFDFHLIVISRTESSISIAQTQKPDPGFRICGFYFVPPITSKSTFHHSITPVLTRPSTSHTSSAASLPGSSTSSRTDLSNDTAGKR